MDWEEIKVSEATIPGDARDVAEHKTLQAKSEEARAEERNLLRTLIDNLPDYV
jgi:hypothetical protein